MTSSQVNTEEYVETNQADWSLSNLKYPPKEYLVEKTFKSYASEQNDVWRDIRARVLGAAWQLLEDTIELKPRIFELRPVGWKTDPDGVESFYQPDLFLFTQREMEHLGVDVADGYCFMCLNTEYNDNEERFSWYIRGIACLGMIDVIERLRQSSLFWGYPRTGPTVHIEPEPVADLKSAVHGLFEPHYSTIYYGPLDEAGRPIGPNANEPDCYLYENRITFEDELSIDDYFVLKNLQVSLDLEKLEYSRKA